MSLSAMKSDLHDRLWNAQQRWFALRAEGTTKHGLKLRGLRECGDPNRFTRNLIFAGSTRRSYEDTLKTFVEFAHEKFGAQRLEDIGKQEFKAFIEDGVARGLAASTLEARCSHLSKLGALIGRSEQFIALARRTAGHIRELGQTRALAGPRRITPSPQIAARALEILRSWDERHLARTGEPRAYHLAARLQLETAGRSVSVTDRLTRGCLKEGNRVEIIGKGGRPVQAPVSADLHTAITLYLGKAGEPLAARRGYQMAWRRAVQAAAGRATGSHGLRRLSTREYYRLRYARRVEGGEAAGDARRTAREEAVERLGHSRNRSDQAACYLDSVA